MNREELIQEFRERAEMFGQMRIKAAVEGNVTAAAYYTGREDAYYAAAGTLADERPVVEFTGSDDAWSGGFAANH